MTKQTLGGGGLSYNKGFLTVEIDRSIIDIYLGFIEKFCILLGPLGILRA